MGAMLFGPSFDPSLLRRSREKDEDYYLRLRGIVDSDREIGNIPRDKVEQALESLGHGGNRNQTSVVVALLDDDLPNAYPSVQELLPFSAGASTSHIFCHAGILQHGEKKIDREGRDYLIKPLIELGVIERAHLDSGTKTFLLEWGKPKASTNCYRLAGDFRSLLSLPEEEFRTALERWTTEDAVRERARFQAEAEALTESMSNPHADLIRASIDVYAPRFLPGYVVVYTDVTDGDRISESHAELLVEAEVELTLADAYPDVLLWNRGIDAFWVVEAVTSDGEVDQTKVESVEAMLARRGRPVRVGFTTAYATWQDAARRQKRVGNLAPGSYVWILGDAARHFRVEVDPASRKDATNPSGNA